MMISLKRAAALAGISVLASGCAGVFGGLHHVSNGGGSGSGGPESAYQCPTSDSASSIARSAPARAGTSARGRFAPYARPPEAPADLIAVNYDAASISQNRERLAAREQALGASFVREYAFAHLGIVTRVVRPASGSAVALEGALRTLPGVRSVGLTGGHRHLDSVNAPLLTNDPVFDGFGAPAPLYQTSSGEGQWDMHVARLEYAFAYSQSGNGSSTTNLDALGSANVKIAVIDTGIDTTHPDMTRSGSIPKVGYQKCFITDPTGTQSTSDFEIDEQGHGTNVAGIAAAEPDNAIGFAGAGGNVSIDAYRIFPTPDDSCITDDPDEQCTDNTQDVASAIEDAVTQKVSVINMSFGGGGCATAGVDDDIVEGTAVADAVAANIVVVAAAGNDGSNSLEAPACDAGVIAVGATGLSDGTTNGSGNTNGSTANPEEYVATYSDYGSPGAIAGSANAWGIVAPGGDPSSATDADNLHFIENIWTSTPFDDNFTAASCSTDEDSSENVDDCRSFTAGTSDAAPMVSGAAALILSVSGNYQSPAAMKQLFCSTADNIGSPNEGCGRIDIYRAMASALHDQVLPGPQPTP
jgi:subtilisin family serine protease